MVGLTLLLAGCENLAPSATILSPEDGAELAPGENLLLKARVSDPESPTPYLMIAWTSDVDGKLDGTIGWEEDVISVLYEDELSTGPHTVTLDVEDPDGNAIKRQVTFTVAANVAPEASWSSPEEGGLYASSYAIPVNVGVSDVDQESLRHLALAWSGSGVSEDASLPEQPSSDGRATGSLGEMGEPGDWEVTVLVTDTFGAEGSATVSFSTIDKDADGDGRITEELDGNDCDDQDAAVYPGADETCDGVDDDCDDEVDEDAVDAATWYVDGDGDGYGYEWDAIESCEDPGAGYASEYGDCYDGDAEQAPDLPEVCDEKDNDCDDDVDEGC